MLAAVFASLLAASPAAVSLRPAAATPPLFTTLVPEAACDDGVFGGTLVQRHDQRYGNRFALPCGAARVTNVRFIYQGHDLPGPYAFRLHLVDAACAAHAVTDVLLAPAARAGAAEMDVDVRALGWCTSGTFMVLLEPLTCTNASDCFPALGVDASGSGDGAAHCAVVSTASATGRTCHPARTADGRFLDFHLRVGYDCDAAVCRSGVRGGAWGRVKKLFLDAGGPDGAAGAAARK